MKQRSSNKIALSTPAVVDMYVYWSEMKCVRNTHAFWPNIVQLEDVSSFSNCQSEKPTAGATCLQCCVLYMCVLDNQARISVALMAVLTDGCTSPGC